MSTLLVTGLDVQDVFLVLTIKFISNYLKSCILIEKLVLFTILFHKINFTYLFFCFFVENITVSTLFIFPGLDTGECDPENLSRLKTLIPESLYQYLDSKYLFVKRTTKCYYTIWYIHISKNDPFVFLTMY